jgi:deoxycytidylate deaminase
LTPLETSLWPTGTTADPVADRNCAAPTGASGTRGDVKSGERIEVGCHHAEMNVLCNAAANGTATRGSWLIVTGEPCTMCAKLVHHAGVARVICVQGGYAGGSAGVEYLLAHGVEVEYREGPADPRRAGGS